MTPAPRNPIPETLWPTMRLEFPTPVSISPSMVNAGAAAATRPLVRVPAIRCRHCRSRPIVQPSARARAKRIKKSKGPRCTEPEYYGWMTPASKRVVGDRSFTVAAHYGSWSKWGVGGNRAGRNGAGRNRRGSIWVARRCGLRLRRDLRRFRGDVALFGPVRMTELGRRRYPERVPMKKAYERWIRRREDDLCSRATNRVVRDFEWGLEWARDWPCARRHPKNGEAPEDYVAKLNQLALLDSDEFFAYERPGDFRLSDGILRFRSPIESPYPENNIVHAQWFPAKDRRKAVVLLPHWNAPVDGHNALCRGLQRLGISALRISLPYHDYRMPPELQRADYAVSSNVCRTMHAARQAVIDVRCCFDWLESERFERLGIVGTSLGSSYACLVSAHDSRIAVN